MVMSFLITKYTVILIYIIIKLVSTVPTMIKWMNIYNILDWSQVENYNQGNNIYFIIIFF